MQLIWDFFQKQVLGMGWLNTTIGSLLGSIGVDINERLGASLQFFFFDLIKILVLLSVLIFIISYIQSHFPPERTKKILGRFKGIGANIVSALLGTVTPFCSCSSIPIFIGFTNAGLPVGVTFSFLISSPLVDLGALVLLLSVFGARIAISYVVVGLVLAVVGGTIIDKLGMEKYVERFKSSSKGIAVETQQLTKKDRLSYAKEQTLGTVKRVWDLRCGGSWYRSAYP
jgi:Predicted permeases